MIFGELLISIYVGMCFVDAKGSDGAYGKLTQITTEGVIFDSYSPVGVLRDQYMSTETLIDYADRMKEINCPK